MGQYVQIVPIKFKTGTAVAGTPAYIDTQSFPFPLTIAVTPGAGSVLVEISATPNASEKTTSAIWFPWPTGTTAVKAIDYVLAPVAGIRVTANGANATWEISA
jgi:hypothetical protein